MKLMKTLALLVALVLPVTANAVDVQRVVSPGGIEAWLVEDHANPVISMRFAFQGGAQLDPVGKSGLANLAASTMDEGAGDLDSQAFQQRLADQAIQLSFEAGLDQFSGRIKTLTRNADEAFDLLRLALTEPRFDAEPVGRIKSQIQANIRADSEKPGRIAYDALFAALFPGDGYARPSDGTEDSIQAIAQDDLRTFARTRLGIANLKIGVSGDITPARLGELLDATFGGLPKSPRVSAATQDVEPQPSGRLVVIDKDITQSTIVFGHAGLKREHPDFYAALVMNHVLGGGSFTSRLYDEVREKRGLAYSVGSHLYPLDRAGLILGSAATENARVGETIAIVRDQWRRMAAGELTADELDNAKTYVTGSFPLRFTSTDAVARILVSMQVNELGLDYLDRRNAFIADVTLADVKRVAAAHLDAEKLDIIVVGRPRGLSSTR